MEINQLKDVASQVRRDIIRMVHACQSGHPGGSLGATDIFISTKCKSILRISEWMQQVKTLSSFQTVTSAQCFIASWLVAAISL